MKHLPWLMSAMTITVMWLAGNKSPLAWRLSLLNQALWLAWILWSHNYGLLPLTAAMVFVGVRNLRKWSPVAAVPGPSPAETK